MLQECPELLLPFAIYILAHHIDFPRPEELTDEQGAATLQAFMLMLQFALEALLLPDAPSAYLAGVCTPSCPEEWGLICTAGEAISM